MEQGDRQTGRQTAPLGSPCVGTIVRFSLFLLGQTASDTWQPTLFVLAPLGLALGNLQQAVDKANKRAYADRRRTPRRMGGWMRACLEFSGRPTGLRVGSREWVWLC